MPLTLHHEELYESSRQYFAGEVAMLHATDVFVGHMALLEIMMR
jgi:hypothetical protein